MREMRWGTRSMSELRKQIFGNAKLALRTKLQLLEATAETRLLFNAGAWTPLKKAEVSFLRQPMTLWRVCAGVVDPRLRQCFGLQLWVPSVVNMWLRHVVVT